MKKLLLFASTTGYQIRVFEEAARRLGIDLTLATDRCHHLDDPWGDRAVAVRFHDTAETIAAARETFAGGRFDGVAAVGDKPAILAAEVAHSLDLPFHPAAAARASADKSVARARYRAAGLPVPASSVVDLPLRGASWDGFPCVIKPLASSASRGVIRADDGQELIAAASRLHRMGEERSQIETYIPGREFAIEGLMTHGVLHPVAIFDKPDPLEGPYFEESIYTTPSREPAHVQAALLKTAEAAAQAIGLHHGPVHLELRYNEHGAWILEAHARPIGGLCARTLRFEGGAPWEEIILRHAVGDLWAAPRLEAEASGVKMVSIPSAGIYQTVEGLEAARSVEDIEDVVITAVKGQRLVMPPEGSSYLGFIFARAASPAKVEAALRESDARLHFVVYWEFDVLNAQSTHQDAR